VPEEIKLTWTQTLIEQSVPKTHQALAQNVLQTQIQFIDHVLNKGGCLGPRGGLRPTLKRENYGELSVLKMVGSSVWIAPEAVRNMVVLQTISTQGVNWSFFSLAARGECSYQAIPELLSAFKAKLGRFIQPQNLANYFNLELTTQQCLAEVIAQRGTYYLDARALLKR